MEVREGIDVWDAVEARHHIGIRHTTQKEAGWGAGLGEVWQRWRVVAVGMRRLKGAGWHVTGGWWRGAHRRRRGVGRRCGWRRRGLRRGRC